MKKLKKDSTDRGDWEGAGIYVGRAPRESGGRANKVFHKEGNYHKGYRLLGGWEVEG